MHDETANKEVLRLTRHLKPRREELRMSRVAVEAVAGIESNYLGQIETGMRTPSLRTFVRLCDAVGLEIQVVEKEGMEVPEWMKTQVYRKRKKK